MSCVSRYITVAFLLVCSLPLFAEDAFTLEAAIKCALANNPRQGVARAEVTAATAHLRGARVLRNPELLVAPTVLGTTGADSVAMVAQPLEINGVRQARTRIATGELAAAQAAAQVTTRDVMLTVSTAYWDLAQAIAIAAVDAENVRDAETLVTAAKKQVELGNAPTSQSIKAEVELARAQQQLSRSQSAVAQAIAILNSAMGRDPAAGITLANALTDIPVGCDLSTLASMGGTARPELAQAQAQVLSATGEVAAARAARRPDLAVLTRLEDWGGPGGVALGVTLPLVDWGSTRAEQQRARAALSARQQRIAVVRQTVQREIQTATIAVRGAETQLRILREQVLKPAETLAKMATLGYQEGATNYLEVLEARRTLRAANAEYFTTLADYHKALAQLAWASGSPTFPSATKEPIR